MRLNVIMPTTDEAIKELQSRCSKAGAYLVNEYLKAIDLSAKEKREIVQGISREITNQEKQRLAPSKSGKTE